ncbi:hypothetical protein PENSPDRAFT_407414 [Peniophora sp. CONT]|nr:hypothetical protein PENSPDRAFT_407414 [Peniophora sp. CONT]
MSSAEEDDRPAGSRRGVKRRKVVACDMCRRRKIKCEERLKSTGKCPNCVEFGWNCTYAQAPTKLFPPGYVEALEVKVKRLEALIKRVLPGRDFSHEVGHELTKTNWMEPGVLGVPQPEADASGIEAPSTFASLQDTNNAKPTGTSVVPVGISHPQPSDDYPSSDEEANDLITKLQHLSLSGPTIVRSWGFSNYLGKSSTVGMVLIASRMLKQLYGPCHRSGFQVETTPNWVSAYMREVGGATYYSFPDTDLMYQLVDLYFRFVNIFTPILHRPTIERELAADFHLKNRAFGGVTLLVCALGSLVSNDSRVVIQDDSHDWHSAGWAWFSQVHVMDRSFVCGEELYGLQIAALATSYMARTCSPVLAWTFAGFGIRLAQNVGAHKRRAYMEAVTAEDEQYRRVTWVLIMLDLTLSKGLGRPCNVQEEEFDLQMPQSCDDEYWIHEDPQTAFMQPEDKPSYMCYFLCAIRMSQILRLALRTIYASAKAKSYHGYTGKEWLLRTISHFDSLMNGWADLVPEHLRWDPTRADGLHFLQSTALWVLYHETRILIHRPFIAPFDDTSKPFPPFTTCMNASRSLIHIMTMLEERQPAQMIILPAETIANASLLSLIAIGAHKLNQTPLDIEQAKHDVAACLDILQKKAHRWRWGSRFLNVLQPLMAICDAPDIPTALAGQAGRPREMSSWHPAATGRDGRKPVSPKQGSGNSRTDHTQSSLGNLSSFSGLDWEWDWSVLSNLPLESAASSNAYTMDPFDPIAALDTIDGNGYLSQPDIPDAIYGAEAPIAPEGQPSTQVSATSAPLWDPATSSSPGGLGEDMWSETSFHQNSRYWPYSGGGPT